MADYSRIHSAVANALQFLGPLGELERVLREAAGAEGFLRDAGPRLQQAKSATDEAERRLQAIRVQIASESGRLERLQREGERLVQDRVNSVEVELAQRLQSALKDVKDAEEQAGRAKAHLLGEITGLAEKRDRLLADIGELDMRRERLLDDLAKIVKAAGGS